MNIHKRFDTPEAYSAYFMEILEWARNPDKSLWNSEDYPKLLPYFNCQNSTEPWTDEVKESFKLYQKLSDDYANERRDIRDSVNGYEDYELCESFGFVYDEGPEDDDDFMPTVKLDETLTFPLIVTGAIEAGWDRQGNYKYCCIRIVEAKEFLN